MSAFVCDASVLFKLTVAERETPIAFALAEAHEINVPELVFAEIANGLWARVRSGASTSAEVDDLLATLNGYEFIVHSIRRHIERALSLANALNHPIYDCVYLALAESLGCPLVTADARFLNVLRRAAYRAVEVRTLVDFS